jgi:hypothetical protein
MHGDAVNGWASKVASAYRFADRIVLHSQARTPAWFCIACEPYLTLSREAGPEAVGQAVRSVLDGYRPDIPQPSDLKQVTAAFVRGLGAKSNKQIQESSVCCGIRDQEGQLVFEPTHNGGTSGDAKGFQPITQARVSLRADAPAAEIGAALLRGFDLCTTIYESA